MEFNGIPIDAVLITILTQFFTMVSCYKSALYSLSCTEVPNTKRERERERERYEILEIHIGVQ